MADYPRYKTSNINEAYTVFPFSFCYQCGSAFQTKRHADYPEYNISKINDAYFFVPFFFGYRCGSDFWTNDEMQTIPNVKCRISRRHTLFFPFFSFSFLFFLLSMWKWLLNARRNADYPECEMSDISDVYTLCFYFAMTTLTTVGYGDIGGNNRVERIYCAVLQVDNRALLRACRSLLR